MRRRRFFLLQVRDQPEAEDQERACFLKACGLDDAELSTHNVVASPDLRWNTVRDAEVLMIGGAGEHTATVEYPFSGALGDVVERWLETGRPFFGSCFGHHFVARRLGGRVQTDPASEEVGTFDVELTREGRMNPLLTGFPARFPVQLGHHDRVVELPPGAKALAHSQRCPNQAIALAGELAYTTQFHPELTLEDIRSRLLMYREGYLDGEADASAVDSLLRPSPVSTRILARFVELVDGG